MRPADSSSTRRWLGPLLAVLMAQIAVTFLIRLAPTLAPALAARLEWQVAEIGRLSAVVAGGSALFMLLGLPLVLRAGAVRSLQLGLVVGALGLLLLLVPWMGVPLLGSLLLGFAQGPQAAGGSDVLRRYAPAGAHNFVFSLKGAGVPIAGVLAGLLMPALALRIGLEWTVLVCAATALVTLAAMQPLRRELDATRDRAQSIHPRALLSLGNLQRPLRALAEAPMARQVALAGCCFGFGQGIWFSFLVSHLVLQVGLTLPQAGAAFALMQGVSAFGRPAMGWLADRVPATTVQRWACAGSTLSTLLLAVVTPGWPGWALVALMLFAGCTVSSWNGVQAAQVAQHSLQGKATATATGSSLLIFLANMAGPLLFGWIVALGAGFRTGFLMAALGTLLAMLPLTRLARAQRRAH